MRRVKLLEMKKTSYEEQIRESCVKEIGLPFPVPGRERDVVNRIRR